MLLNYLYLCGVMNENEKERNRNEKLGEYFLNLSNTTLGTTVLGMLVSTALNLDSENYLLVISIIIIGLLATIGLANLGNEFLKK